MKTKTSIVSVLSLAISVIALGLYVVLFEGLNVFIPWIVLSVLSILFPVFSKYIRNKNGMKGKVFEIIALVIGAFDFYAVFFAATEINLVVVYFMIAVICILYVKLFNKTAYDNTKVNDNSNFVSNKKVDTACEICFCRKCGEKLICDSKFCCKCGTEVVILEDE